MCGIAGIANGHDRVVPLDALTRMAYALRHRGPDGYGFYCDARVGLVHLRLALVDRVNGAQPLTNEDGSIVIICNGELFNHRELRAELRALGHRFFGDSDSEVLAHGWEQWGEDLFARLAGQFACAILDRRQDTVVLARDRFGICPLFYVERPAQLVFASEAKGLFASGAVPPRAHLPGLDQVFHFWSARAPATPFADVHQLEPGCLLRWKDGELQHRRWYAWAYGDARVGSAGRMEPDDVVERLHSLLGESVAERLPPDGRFGAYLSGGLDSSIVCSLAAAASQEHVRTFSLHFSDDPSLDEAAAQHTMSTALGSRHVRVPVGAGDLAAVFPSVMQHIETPVTRTAPAAMYLLAREVRAHGLQVVLSGEGADELFLGYDLFKEAAIRRFCLRQPNSKMRPRLLDRLYPYLGEGGRGAFWRQFFLSAGEPDDPLFSHQPRIANARWARGFYSAEMTAAVERHDPLAQLRSSLPAAFGRWAHEHQAAFLELETLLSPYLLSSQGDRVGMAWAVEGRFPFLDHRLFEYASQLPARANLRGRRDKDLLRRWAAGRLPAQIVERQKQPLRAPDAPAFTHARAREYVTDLLSTRSLFDAGYFRPEAVHGLMKRCHSGSVLGVREHQAFVGIVSTQLWHHTFLRRRPELRELPLAGAQVLLGSALLQHTSTLATVST
jgi:asparagine synthase (glutamine-hydrolysing)